MANVRHLISGFISPKFQLVFGDSFRRLLSRDTMKVQLKQYAVTFFISIDIGTPKMSLTVLEISFIVSHPFTVYGWMIGDKVIGRKS